METSRRGREQIVYSKKKKKNSVYKRQMDSDLQQKLILKGIMVEDFNLEEIRADQKKRRETLIISNSKVQYLTLQAINS